MHRHIAGPSSNLCRTKKELDAITVDEKELEDQIQVHGSYRKPEPMDLAIVQFWLLPMYAYKSIAWHVRWLRRYQFGNEEYTEDDKEYIARCGIHLCCFACMVVYSAFWCLSACVAESLSWVVFVPEHSSRYQ